MLGRCVGAMLSTDNLRHHKVSLYTQKGLGFFVSNSLISTVHGMLSVVLRGENTHFIVLFRNFGTRCFV